MERWLITLTISADFDVEVVWRERAAQAKAEPHNPGNDREQRYNGDKVPGDDICDSLDRCAARLSFANYLYDVVQPGKSNGESGPLALAKSNLHGLPTDLIDPDVNDTSLVDRAQEHLITSHLLDQPRLPRQ